jgi:hypothetical protein
VKFRPPESEPPNEPKSETDMVPGQPRAPELTDPEVNSGREPSSASSQQADFHPAIYAAEGKKQSRRSISGTARDVGNATEGVAAG